MTIATTTHLEDANLAIAARVGRRCASGVPSRRWDDAALRALAAGGADRDAVAAAMGRTRAEVDARLARLAVAAGAPRTLDGEQAAALAAALLRKGGLLAYARELHVDPRWLRAEARRLGHGVQRRRRRAMDDEGRAEVVRAALSGMTVTAAIRTLGRDLRTLKAVAAEAGVAFAAVEREPAKPAARKPLFRVVLPVFDDEDDGPDVRSAATRPTPARRAAPVAAPASQPTVAAARPPASSTPAKASAEVARRQASARRSGATPTFDRAGLDDAVARFLAARGAAAPAADPVEETVRAIRRRGYSVVRDGAAFLIDGRVRLDDGEALALFARDRMIAVPGLAAAGAG